MLAPGIPESKNFDELKEFFTEKYICCAMPLGLVFNTPVFTFLYDF
jgi:hypothetical protein